MKAKKMIHPDHSSLDIHASDYFDTYAITLVYQKTDHDLRALISRIASRIPYWILLLLKIRDTAMKYFGLKTQEKSISIDDFIHALDSQAKQIGIVNIYTNTDHEIILGLDDTHLNFKSSLCLERQKNALTLYISTVVTFNSFWGKLYFFIIRPFHYLIVRSLLNRLAS